MQLTSIPKNETERLLAVKSYKLDRSQYDQNFNIITNLACSITNMPNALISIVEEDEVWFKSAKGMTICSSERNLSFCSYAIANDEDVYVVENTKKNLKFINHPYVKASSKPIVFYAGVCLIDQNNHKLGTLCVIDHKENHLNDDQIKNLKLLGKQVVKLIELNKSNHKLKQAKRKLIKKNKMLKGFASQVAHDMKMPLANMILTTDILKKKYNKSIDEKGTNYLNNIKDASLSLSSYINNLLNYYENSSIDKKNVECFSFNQLLEEVIDILNIKVNCRINLPEKDFDIVTNRAALELILLNLITNSLKYNDKPETVIDVFLDTEDEKHNYISVTDNGIGIPEEKQKKIFKLFSTVEETDRFGQRGHGIGLSTVKKLVSKLGGNINVKSKQGEGCTFKFSIKK
ncbi:GAF domain-containing sensor histidine kinase [Neotamlana laminarinivorans]|uniref:histidine kinase n=1 Tax=Neotamlana laminarinivorans TaxID=2883124 RepID=A0A9X1HWN3_9FLAO|nr:HAMP domain-containing sensor histidine kinase [Tamlana laminarinivorans]MCB4797539.1 HAMP domain-containing histidine kinase [Tamlana laminarinivorans]